MKKKIILIVICVLVCIPFLNGCTHKKDIKVTNSMICQIKSDKLSSQWTFDMNSQNEILSMVLNTELTYEKIKAAFPKANKDTLIQTYLNYKKKLGTDYSYIVSKYPQGKSWFSGSFNYDDSYMKLQSLYTFNVAHERFNYELENSFLSEFGIDILYKDTKAGFHFDENIVKLQLFANKDIECKEKER